MYKYVQNLVHGKEEQGKQLREKKKNRPLVSWMKVKKESDQSNYFVYNYLGKQRREPDQSLYHATRMHKNRREKKRKKTFLLPLPVNEEEADENDDEGGTENDYHNSILRHSYKNRKRKKKASITLNEECTGEKVLAGLTLRHYTQTYTYLSLRKYPYVRMYYMYLRISYVQISDSWNWETKKIIKYISIL